MTKILNNNENKDNKNIDILIIISLIYPLRFFDIKEYLIDILYSKDFDALENYYTLKGFIDSTENAFNNNFHKPLILIESNKQDLEQKIEYIKTILYPKLLSTIKYNKGVPLSNSVKSPSKNMKASTSNINNNLLSTNEKNNQNNNNIINIENKENSIKYMIIKENIRSNNYDNIIQIVKYGGLIIINNISIFDQSFLSQIIHIINDANNNKYMDRSFRLIFTLTEPFINDNINEILLKNCIYFNVDLNDDIYKSSFKSIILESIKNIDDTLILFFSNNI